MKYSILLLALSIFSLSAIGQKSKKKVPFLKYKKIYYSNKTIEGNGYTVELNNIIDYDGELKFSFKVLNIQNEYILLKGNGTKITKLGTEFPISEKTKLIAPQKSKSQTIKCLGSGDNRAEIFTFFGNSLFSLKVDQSAQKIDSMKIPLARKDFEFNSVKCFVDVKEKSTQTTKIVTTVKNNSKDYLFIYPSRIALKMPDGNTYTSNNSKEVIIIAPNKSGKVTCKWDRMPGGKLNDMQLVVMNLIFDDVFYFSSIKPMDSFSIDVEWNEVLTEAKK